MFCLCGAEGASSEAWPTGVTGYTKNAPSVLKHHSCLGGGPPALKRCLLSQNRLELSISLIPFRLQALLSHVSSDKSLLNLLIALLVTGGGPLIKKLGFQFGQTVTVH